MRAPFGIDRAISAATCAPLIVLLIDRNAFYRAAMASSNEAAYAAVADENALDEALC